MKTTTFFIEIPTDKEEVPADRFLSQEVRIDIILSSTSRESMHIAQRMKDVSKEHTLIHADGNLNYQEKTPQAMLERQVERIYQILTREYSRKTVLIISHKEIIERLMAKNLQIPLEESRRIRGWVGQYRCCQKIIN